MLPNHYGAVSPLPRSVTQSRSPWASRSGAPRPQMAETVAKTNHLLGPWSTVK